MGKYRVFTDEDIEFAKSIDIMSYLSSKGYSFKKHGNNKFLLEPHSSLVIFYNTNSWFYYKENIGGNLINFLQQYENKTFQEALFEILEEPEQIERKYTKYVSVKEEKGELVLPQKNKDNKRAYAYLTKTRGLDEEIVKELLNTGYIYENEKGGVVFLSKDKDDKVKYACVRSTNQNSTFKQDIENSNKDYGFKTVGKSDKLFVFEAPIDLLSHATISKMQGKDWKEDNRIALCCAFDKSLSKFLEENNHIKEIILFLDNDETGIKNAQKIMQKYGNDYNIKIFTSQKGKDLNEVLVNYKIEKNLHKDLKINTFIKELESPFIPPKCIESNIIDISQSKTKDIDFYKFAKNNLLEIKETTDSKVVFLFKENDKFKVIKGGFEIDFKNNDFKAKLLNGSKENFMFLENLEENSENKSLVITNDVLLYVYHKVMFKDYFNMVLTDDLKTENIKNILNKLPAQKNVLIANTNDTINIDELKKDFLNTNICVNNNFVDYKDIFIQKDTNKYSIKDKIKEKQSIITKNNQEKNMLENNKKISNISI